MADKMTKSIIVKGPVNRIYGLWSNFENFPNFMKNIKSVRKTGNRTSHWVLQGPMGKKFEWDARITDEQPNKRIAWNSIQGDLTTSGEVAFNQLDQEETEITVNMQYNPPAGKAGEAAAHIFDNPDKKLTEDLRRFKKYAERSGREGRPQMPPKDDDSLLGLGGP